MSKHPLKIDSGVIIVEVTLTGKLKTIPLKMVIDTGASITTIPKEAALAIGCDPMESKRSVEMITASGTEFAPVVTIPTLRFLNFELKNVEAICHTLPPQATVSGLLGLNVLRNFRNVLDFPAKFLEIIKPG